MPARDLMSAAAIEDMIPELGPGLLAAAEMAVMELVRFDACHAPMRNLLTLAEAAGSCSLDGITAPASQIILSTLGGTSSPAGTVISCALAVSRAGRGRDLLDAEGLYALNRTILGGRHCTHTGDFRELAGFITRSDVPMMVHAALAHAWLAGSEHFRSGGGRTARAMNTAMFRAAGATVNIPVPLSAALAGNPDGYRGALRLDTAGPEPMVELLIEGTFIALDNAAILAAELAAAAEAHEELLGAARSPAALMLTGNLGAVPALTASAAMRMTGASESAAYRALDQLEAAGILVPSGKTGGVLAWTAPQIVSAFDAFLGRTLGQQARVLPGGW